MGDIVTPIHGMPGVSRHKNPLGGLPVQVCICGFHSVTLPRQVRRYVSIQVGTATRQDRKEGCMDDTAYAQQAQAAITDIDRRISRYSAELSQVRQKIKELEEDHNN